MASTTRRVAAPQPVVLRADAMASRSRHGGAHDSCRFRQTTDQRPAGPELLPPLLGQQASRTFHNFHQACPTSDVTQRCKRRFSAPLRRTENRTEPVGIDIDCAGLRQHLVSTAANRTRLPTAQRPTPSEGNWRHEFQPIRVRCQNALRFPGQ